MWAGLAHSPGEDSHVDILFVVCFAREPFFFVSVDKHMGYTVAFDDGMECVNCSVAPARRVCPLRAALDAPFIVAVASAALGPTARRRQHIAARRPTRRRNRFVASPSFSLISTPTRWYSSKKNYWSPRDAEEASAVSVLPVRPPL